MKKLFWTLSLPLWLILMFVDLILGFITVIVLGAVTGEIVSVGEACPLGPFIETWAEKLNKHL